MYIPQVLTLNVTTVSSDSVQKATSHQVTTMLATSKNVLFTGHNHLLSTGTDDSTLIITLAHAQAIIKVSGNQYRWLAGGYNLEIGHFYKWLARWLPGG